MLSRLATLCTIAVLGIFPLTWTAVRAQKPAATASRVDFVRDIRPILQRYCYECHGARKSKGHLRLDLRAAALKGSEDGPVIIPGNSERSPIVRRLLGLDGDDRMPKDGDPLPPGQIALIRAWIDQGAAATRDPGGVQHGA
jgi:mono/diheme cytochrome c family protein